MRFISNGPIIPDILLSERDAGRVVFLCGAGVSIPAGMPTFIDLTKFVIDQFSPPPDSEIQREFAPWIEQSSGVSANARTSLDQIFNLLQFEYGRDQVGKLVSQRLAVSESNRTRTTEHKLIARISSDQNGIPQIVTTNFDHLFEHAVEESGLQTFIPPTFPDLRHNVPVTGITYLHGRLSETNSEVHDYILSSSDFGRAYLSEGWATSFMRQLLGKYTVVLLGYQAEDPPVKYLLQGLSSGRDNTKKKIYAFDQGLADEIETKWRDLGVLPIAYPESDRHQSLWDTLEAWAIRSDNSAAWRASTIDFSQKGPQNMEPHERGMVAHILRTTIGAKQFADTVPSPPIEWLLMFDRDCRYRAPSKNYDQSAEIFDPLEVYGLDDDPPRPSENEKEKFIGKDDLIAWRQGDDSLDPMQRLSGGFSHGSEPLPSRLFHLTRWMLNHVEHPTLAWWTARQYQLHPRLYSMLKREIEKSDKITEKERNLWMILFEIFQKGQNDSSDLKWFQIERRIKISGWTNSVVRAFETVTEPGFKISSPSGIMRSRPPIDDWSNSTWRDIADIDIHFPSMYNEIPEVPDKNLPSVFAALNRNLIKASERLNEIGDTWFSFTTLYPEDTNKDGGFLKEQDSYMLWFVELLERMLIANSKLLRAYIDTWPEPEKWIFDKLRLYVWNKIILFPTSEVFDKISRLDNTQFWESDSRRELLFLLRDRWIDFSVHQKAKICEQLLKGPLRYESEDEKDHLIRKSTASSIAFGWLLQEGCSIPIKWKAMHRKLIKELPQWDDKWMHDAANSRESMSGFVKTDENDDILKDLPVEQIIEAAQENSGHSFSSFTDYNPFLGLVKNDPVKALSALLLEAQQDKYPANFWNAIISNWPETVSAGETKKFYVSISKLPSKVVFEIRWTIGSWLNDKFPKFVETEKTLAFSIFDSLIKKLLSNGPKATSSSLGETRVGGKVVDRSRKTINHALNGPLGRAIQGLISVLNNEGLSKGQGLPNYFTDRVDLLLKDNGEGADHTTCIVSRQISWLNYLDPSWVSHKMIPWFEFGHPSFEPAWNGILLNDWIKIQSVFDQIKENFFLLLKIINDWEWKSDLKSGAYTWIVQASLLFSDDGPKLTFDEVRDCLRQINHDANSHVIWFLGQIGKANKNGWKKKVIPFIQKAWPRERRFQTEKSSKAWVSMLKDSQKDFSAVYETVRELLCPIRSSHINLYSFYHGNKPLAIQFPNECLDLLNLIILDDPRYVPYGLSQILNILEETNPEIISDRRFERLRELEAQR